MPHPVSDSLPDRERRSNLQLAAVEAAAVTIAPPHLHQLVVSAASPAVHDNADIASASHGPSPLASATASVANCLRSSARPCVGGIDPSTRHSLSQLRAAFHHSHPVLAARLGAHDRPTNALGCRGRSCIPPASGCIALAVPDGSSVPPATVERGSGGHSSRRLQPVHVAAIHKQLSKLPAKLPAAPPRPSTATSRLDLDPLDPAATWLNNIDK